MQSITPSRIGMKSMVQTPFLAFTSSFSTDQSLNSINNILDSVMLQYLYSLLGGSPAERATESATTWFRERARYG